jgi:hypothetical protein
MSSHVYMKSTTEGTCEDVVLAGKLMKLTCVLLDFRHLLVINKSIYHRMHACTLRAATLHAFDTINSKGTIFYLELPIEGYNRQIAHVPLL